MPTISTFYGIIIRMYYGTTLHRIFTCGMPSTKRSLIYRAAASSADPYREAHRP